VEGEVRNSGGRGRGKGPHGSLRKISYDLGRYSGEERGGRGKGKGTPPGGDEAKGERRKEFRVPWYFATSTRVSSL